LICDKDATPALPIWDNGSRTGRRQLVAVIFRIRRFTQCAGDESKVKAMLRRSSAPRFRWLGPARIGCQVKPRKEQMK
jgi:hypothetical protein